MNQVQTFKGNVNLGKRLSALPAIYKTIILDDTISDHLIRALNSKSVRKAVFSDERDWIVTLSSTL